HVVEARCLQGRKALLREPIRGGDEGRVEPEPVRLENQILEIPSQGRLATREPELQHTQRLGFAKHATPLFGRELALEARAREVERIRAVGALERTLVRQLRQEPQRLRIHTSPAPWRRARPETP